MADTNVRVVFTAEGLEALTGKIKTFAGVVGGAFAAKKILDFGAASVKVFQESEAAFGRLEQILRTSTQASDEQIDSLRRQAEALEEVGVVGAEAIMIGQGQLASFDLQAKSIQALTPAILNYAVAEKGANVSSEELKAMTNGLAQALQGNFASLTKTGFILDENTKALISNGTEAERVEALVKVLDSTYAGFNETARATGEGALVGLQFAYEDLQKAVGGALSEGITPFVIELTKLVQNPQFVSFFESLAKVVMGAVTFAFKGLLGLQMALTDAFELMFLAIDKVVGAFNRMADAARRAFDAAKRIGGNVVGAITGRASGGPVRAGTPYVVGEEGPELFVPGASGNIIPNHALAGAGGGINIYISGNTLLDSNAGERIAEMIMRRLRGNLRL